MKKNFIVASFVIFILLCFIAVKSNSYKQKRNSIFSNDCKSINSKQAIEQVKLLPEVKNFLNLDFPDRNKPIVAVDDSNLNTFSIHVYEDVKNGKTDNHTATFNWYSVDKCSGEIKCSFSVYDKNGELVRVSDQNEYPCD